jgi:hypothetical protein
MECQSQENLEVAAAVADVTILPQCKINITLSTPHSSRLLLLQAHPDLDIPLNILESLDEVMDGRVHVEVYNYTDNVLSICHNQPLVVTTLTLQDKLIS